VLMSALTTLPSLCLYVMKVAIAHRGQVGHASWSEQGRTGSKETVWSILPAISDVAILRVLSGPPPHVPL
jgi:hypothetical protein